MMVYRFKDAAHLPKGLRPQDVGERLASIRESEGVGFTPESVLADAVSEASPLHPAFTWDDAQAAAERRLEQAAYLIRSVTIVYRDEARDEEREVRAFFPVTVRDAEEGRYLPIYTAMSDDDYRRQVLERGLGDLLALRRKYQDIQEFARIFAAIDKVAKVIRAA